jgi:hypothetical protein
MAKRASKKKTESRSGGVDISGQKVSVGGDVVGRDKITSSGLKGDELAGLFEPLLATTKQAAPPEKLAEAEKTIAELQEQIGAKTPDIGIVGKSLKWLKKNVPGVSGALNTVLSQPIIGQGIKDIAAVVLDEE